MATQNTAPEDEFVTVSEPVTEPEIKIVFDTIGDQFTGIYLGMREQENENGSYKQARFQSEDGLETYFTNANYSLRNGLKSVVAGRKVRITFTSETDTGQSNPMRNFTVEVARPHLGGKTNIRSASKAGASS